MMVSMVPLPDYRPPLIYGDDDDDDGDGEHGSVFRLENSAKKKFMSSIPMYMWLEPF